MGNTMTPRRHRIRILLVALIAMSTGTLLPPCWAASQKVARPNFILIIGDDISIDDFGSYGHPHIRTPNVDRLAASGMRFNNAYLTTSSCSPTRSSVITGRYPHNTGAPELHQSIEGQVMFPLELKKVGYYTAAYGKWHLGEYARMAFDATGNRLPRDEDPGGEGRWVELLQQRPKDKPFFMWFASNDAHRIWHADRGAEPHQLSDVVVPPYMVDTPETRKDLAQYYDEIQRLDRYTGLVVEELKKQKILDNTVIIFMADNGRPFPRAKTWLYDSGIKTPFIVHWPAGIRKKGAVTDSLVSVLDIAPTILKAAGVAVPESMQGVSMAPVFEDPRAVIREYAFAERNWHDVEGHARLLRWKNWVYIRNFRPELPGLAAGQAKAGVASYDDLRRLKQEGKLTSLQADIFMAPRPEEMLFNVVEDPIQSKNLADNPEYAEILTAMRKTLAEWQERTGDTVPKNLTKSIVDARTGRFLVKPGNVKRGTTPGSERNAALINDPGPR